MTHSDNSARRTPSTRKKHLNTAIKPSAIYNLHQHFECLHNTFQDEALSKKIALSLSIEKDMPVAYCDMDSLRMHVLNSLLANALFHTQAGGKISIHAEKSDDYTMTIKISASDSGMLPDERRNIFFRPPASGKNHAAIYNALRCVQAHKGNISMMNEPERSGATCKIEIPLYTLCMQ